MTGTGWSAPCWLTSGESEVWAGPFEVQAIQRGSGPRPGATYVLLQAVRSRPDGSTFRCVAVDRHRQQWAPPRRRRPREIGIWFGEEALSSWDEGHFTAPRPNPDSWCTLCATEQEATVVAEATRRYSGRSGGW